MRTEAVRARHAYTCEAQARSVLGKQETRYPRGTRRSAAASRRKKIRLPVTVTVIWQRTIMKFTPQTVCFMPTSAVARSLAGGAIFLIHNPQQQSQGEKRKKILVRYQENSRAVLVDPQENSSIMTIKAGHTHIEWDSVGAWWWPLHLKYLLTVRYVDITPTK
jgi:hypothetical protein